MLYIIESHDLDRLNSVCSRLYDGTKLNYDQRRDLARTLESIIGHAQDCEIEEARLYRAALD